MIRTIPFAPSAPRQRGRSESCARAGQSNHATWTQGGALGIRAKGEDGTGVSDITGNTGPEHGYAVATYANGDTTVSRYEGTTTFKDNRDPRCSVLFSGS